MSRRSVLNVTSEKKKNRMFPLTVDVHGGASPTGAISLSPSRSAWVSCFQASSLSKSSDTSTVEGDRTEDTVFHVGYREDIEFRLTGLSTWQWRRVVFRMKGDTIQKMYDEGMSGDAANGAQLAWRGTKEDESYARGYKRVLGRISGSTADSLAGLIFEGKVNVDWRSVFEAPLNRRAIDVVHEETKMMTSRNPAGECFTLKRYYSGGKNMYYSPDGSFVEDSKPGLGDLYVADFLRCVIASQGTDTFTMVPIGTLYWHER